MSKSPAPFDQGLFLMHLHKGKEFFDQDQLQKAREELEAAYHLRPHDEKALNMLGMTYYKLEMLPQAEEMYIILAATNPDIYALHSNLGLIQLKLNKLGPAREALNRALELQPTNSKAHFYMGLLLEKQEMWEDALYHFEQANAEKMVVKMQSKMDEEGNRSELVLPFHVVEVLSSDADTEPSLSSLIQDPIQTQPELAPDGEITGRIRSHDLAQAMFQIHNEETLQQPETGLEMDESPVVTPLATDIPFEPAFDQPQSVDQLPEQEELMEEESVDLMAEKMKEEIQDEASWEKTHASLFPEPFREPDPIVHSDANVLIGPSLDEPFLLSDDIAADISTFLAQSRTEESVEQDVFYHESLLPEFTILTTPERTEPSYPVESNEFRIPSPEEVENEIGETIDESISSEPEAITEPAQAVEEPNPIVERLIEETVEDLSEVVMDEASSVEPKDDEEEIEVNFATNDSGEDAQIQQGFLQPSPLTPEFEEETLEQTQDMAYTMEPHGVTPVEAPETEQQEPPEFAEQKAEGPAGPQTGDSEPPPAEPSFEEPPIQMEPTPATQEEIPVPFEQKPIPDEVVHPANLDQFSRDRLYIQPLIGSDRFLLIDPHLLEIIISEKLVCRMGTISSYTGNLQFTPWGQIKNENAPFIVVSGTGILFLADRRKEIFLISLNNEVIFVESNHLLVAQSSLQIEPQLFQHQNSDASFSVSKIYGRGTLALTCLTKPLTVNVHEGLPANIPARAVIAWSGRVVSEVMDDADLRKVMMNAEDDAIFLRFRGAGDVIVEQGGLWGDRRTKRA